MRIICGVATKDVSDENAKKNSVAYGCWVRMIKRCYSKRYQIDSPTYSDCSVSGEWLFFSNFLSFHSENYTNGYHLDKDLLITGNKIYSKESCLFVPPEINTFNNDCRSRRGGLPIGVYLESWTGRYRTSIGVNGKSMQMGRYDDPMSAHKAWYKKKVEMAYVHKDTCDRIHPDLFAGLLRKIDSMKEF